MASARVSVSVTGFIAAVILKVKRLSAAWPARRRKLGGSDGREALSKRATFSNGKLLAGTLVISGVSSSQFSHAFAAYPANAIAPASGITCQLDPYLFDAVMRSLPAIPLRVNLGPGTFLTRGYDSLSANACWKPRNKMKILGGGIDVTTLMLVEGVRDHRLYAVIGAGFGEVIEDFHAEGFTVDCAIASQVSRLLTCSALAVYGSRSLYRRIRAIHFGRQTLDYECFVLANAGAIYSSSGSSDQPTGCVVEECLIESPGDNAVKETTCIASIGVESSLPNPPSPPPQPALPGVMQAYHRSSVVRNCHIDCRIQATPVSIDRSQLGTGSSPVTVKTRTPHGLGTGTPWVRISGAYDSTNGYKNPYNGSYQATVTDAYSFTYTPASMSPVPATDCDMWLGRFHSQRLPLLAPGAIIIEDANVLALF